MTQIVEKRIRKIPNLVVRHVQHHKLVISSKQTWRKLWYFVAWYIQSFQVAKVQENVFVQVFDRVFVQPSIRTRGWRVKLVIANWKLWRTYMYSKPCKWLKMSLGKWSIWLLKRSISERYNRTWNASLFRVVNEFIPKSLQKINYIWTFIISR